MGYFILIILFGVSVLNPICNIVMQEPNTDERNAVHESIFTVTGTITKVTTINLGKTIFSKRLAMHLYLKTQDTNEELKFIRNPARESDKLLEVGQRVSITAKKNESSEYSDIVYIDWNAMGESIFTTTGTITKFTKGNYSKTSRVDRFVVHLHLKTQDTNEELKFVSKPASKAETQLQQGQRISITAKKNESSEYSDIIYIEPL